MLTLHRIVLSLLAALVASAALAQSVGGINIGADGMTYQEARAKFPQLPRSMFEKADMNGDGIIESNELPALQSMYQLTYGNR